MGPTGVVTLLFSDIERIRVRMGIHTPFDRPVSIMDTCGARLGERCKRAKLTIVT
jgi:hypothetical protein